MMTIEKKVVKAGKFVNTTHVDTVIKNYKQERWVHNSRRLGKEDSLSVWFSVADIEEFLEKAKMHGGDGVRFYFGAYDKEFAERPVYAGRQTLVMVATKERESLSGEVNNKDIYFNDDNGTSILAYNFGSVCPPFCSHDTGIGVTIIDKGSEGLIIT